MPQGQTGEQAKPLSTTVDLSWSTFKGSKEKRLYYNLSAIKLSFSYPSFSLIYLHSEKEKKSDR